MHVRVDTRVRCGDWQGQGTGVERHLSPAGRSGGHWTQMSLDFYGIMITLFTTGDSASRRVDRVVWPKLLRPVLDCAVIVRAHRAATIRRIIYDIRWLSIAGGRALARGGGVRAVTTYVKC